MAPKSEPPSPHRLHKATDRLNGALLEAENALRDLNLGVAAGVPLEGERSLHFRKRGKLFELVVVFDGEPPSENHVLSTSRQTRLQVVGKLAALRDALLRAFDAELCRVEAGIDEVTAFTASLRRPRVK